VKTGKERGDKKDSDLPRKSSMRKVPDVEKGLETYLSREKVEGGQRARNGPEW